MNRIGCISFDLHMRDRQRAGLLLRKWDSFYEHAIEKVIDEVLQKTIPSHLVLEIEQLDLDLGMMEEERMEEYFPLLLREKLQEALLHIVQDKKYTGLQTENEEERLFRLLCTFLLHGMFPWHTADRYRNISYLFLRVLEMNARRFRFFLMTYGHYTGLRRRLVYQLNDPELEAGIRLLAPNESLFICSYLQLLRRKYKELERPLIRQTDYHKVSWLVVYNYLLQQNSSWFNRKSFLLTTLHELASAYNLTYDYLLDIITRDLPDRILSKGVLMGLLLLLQQLKEEWNEQQWKTEDRAILRLYELLRVEEVSFLLPGETDWIRHLEILLSVEDRCRHFLQPLPEVAIYKIVRVLVPAEEEFVIGYARSLDRQQSRGVLQGKAGGEFRLLKWQIIFPVLLEKKGTFFSRKYFVYKVIVQVAAHYNLSVEEILEYLSGGVRKGEELSVLQGVFDQLWEEIVKAKEGKKSGTHVVSSPKAFYRKLREGRMTETERNRWLVLLNEDRFRKDLLLLLPEREHARLIEWIRPGESTFVVEYAMALQEQRIRGALEGKAGGEFRKVKWEFMYEVLVATNRQVFNKSYFVETILCRLSARYNVTVAELVRYFFREEVGRKRLFSFDLWKILQELCGRYKIEPNKEMEKGVTGSYSSGWFTDRMKETFRKNHSFFLFVRPVLEVEELLMRYPAKEEFLTLLVRVSSDVWMQLLTDHRNMSHIDILHSLLVRFLTSSPEMYRQKYIEEIASLQSSHPLLAFYWKRYEKQLRKLVVTSQKETAFFLPDYSYIGNAGLVVIAPYLPVLFSRLGMTLEGDFLSMDQRFRAISLLQYIVYGDTVPAGESLLLNCLLTGTDPGCPLPEWEEPSPEEKEMTASLLKGILQHWSKLKGTSPEGLREAFLQRPGSMEEKNDGYYLTLEKRAYDMLLDTIPWNFRTIKYGWMEKMIVVK